MDVEHLGLRWVRGVDGDVRYPGDRGASLFARAGDGRGLGQPLVTDECQVIPVTPAVHLEAAAIPLEVDHLANLAIAR